MPGTFGQLGKAPAVHDPRSLRLADYTAAVPKPPPEVHRSHREFPWGMLGNDRIGCCTCSAAGHMIEGWQMEAGAPVSQIADRDVIQAYSAVSGYDPTTGTNDNGAQELDVLKLWRSTGIASHKIAAWVDFDWRNATQIKQAIYLFGAAYVGIGLPVTAQAQTGGGVWDVPPGGLTGEGAPWSWGGHAVPVVSYDSQRLAVITWGAVQLMTWRFLGSYGDEAHAVLSQDMLRGGKSNGLNVQQLNADLAAL